MSNYNELIYKVSYNLFDKFINNGNLTNYQRLFEIINKTIDMLKENKDNSLEDIIEISIKDYINKTKEIIETGKTPGISTSIKIVNGPEINIMSGKTSENNEAVEINESVLFDLASCTKLFTAIQALKEYELNNIDINQNINEIDSKFNQDVTILELLNFYHKIVTDKKIDQCSSEEEAINLLYNSKIIESKVHFYSDIPYMIVRRLLPDFENRFKNIFNDELDMKDTLYNPSNNRIITGGNKQNMRVVHDPKARIIKCAGHAGVYTTSHDLIKLFDGLYSLKFLNLNSIYRLTNPILEGDFVKSKDGTLKLIEEIEDGKIVYNPIFIKRGMMYKKHGMGMKKTEVFDESSIHAFSIAGFTGCWANYDIANGFTINILTNPFSGSDENKKDPNYIKYLDKIKLAAFESIIKLIISFDVYDNYYEKNDKYKVRTIKKIV